MSSAQAHSLSPINNNNPIIFQSLRRSSIEFLSFVTIPPHTTLINNIPPEVMNTASASSTTGTYLLPVIHQFNSTTSQIQHEFLCILKDLLLNGLNTLDHSRKEQMDAADTLDTLNNLMAAVARFTDESLDSVARNASATLRALSLRAQDLEKQLAKAKVSAQVFNVLFSTLAIGCAAVVSPVVPLAVAPLLLRIDPLCKILMTKQIKENQKVIEAIRLMVHSAIVKAGRIKDIVQDLNILVAEPMHVGDVILKRLDELRKAVVDAVAQVEMVEMEL